MGLQGGPTLGFNLVLMSNHDPPKRAQFQSNDQDFIYCTRNNEWFMNNKWQKLYPKHMYIIRGWSFAKLTYNKIGDWGLWPLHVKFN